MNNNEWGRLDVKKCFGCKKKKVVRDDICYECWNKVEKEIKL